MVPLDTTHGVTVSKLRYWIVVNEFDPHWVPHTFALVLN